MKTRWSMKWVPWVVFLCLATSCATQKTLSTGPQPDTSAPSVKAAVIQDVTFSEEGGYTRVRVEGASTLPAPLYNVLSDPPRIVIDVPNVDLMLIKAPLKINNGTIGEVLATQFDDKGRIEIGLTATTQYNITREDRVLIIDVEKVKPATEGKVTAKEEEKKEEPKKEEEPIKEKSIELSSPPTPPPPAPVVKEPMKKAKKIVDVSLDLKDEFVTFLIHADGSIGNFDSFKLDSPPRLVVDLWELGSRYPKPFVRLKNPYIKEIRLGQHKDKLRLVFDSLKPQIPSYQIDRVEDKLLVSFGKVPAPPGPQVQLGKEISGKPTKEQEKGPPASGEPKKTTRALLTGVDFKQIEDKSRIAITTTEEPTFEAFLLSKKVIAIDLKNAVAPKKLLRGLDTGEFKSAVSYVGIQNVRSGKTNDVRILIKLKEEVPYGTTSDGKTLFVDVEGLPKPPVTVEKAAAPKEAEPPAKKEEAKKEEERKEEEKKAPEPKKAEGETRPVEGKAPALAEVPKKPEEAKRGAEEGVTEKLYQGQKVSLDFKDADIKNILRLIAEVSNLNIIAGEDVTGKVTMRLVDVPWDQALDIILQSRALGMSRVGNVVRVAPQDTLKKEIQAELEAKRAKEKLEDLMMELIPVNYATAKELLPQVKAMLSDRGDIKVDERTNILIVKDITRNIMTAKSLVKSLDTKTPQVLIEARIVEANLTFQRELGISWGMQVVGGKTTGNQATVQGGLLNNKIIDMPAIPNVGTPGILEFLFNSVHALRQLDIAISAHETKGDARVISAPKIATLDNKEASIEQGLRIPYLKLTTEGTVTTDFIDANLKLTVTPHVTNDGNIKLNIKAKKDAPDTSITVQGVPSIDKKEAITEVLIRDTGVVVIGGIYTIVKTNSNEGVPILNKIPLLGWLFKKEEKLDERKDLLIFISPKIIRDEV